jgi:hypothetical protein
MVEKQSYRPPFHHKLLSHLRPLVPSPSSPVGNDNCISFEGLTLQVPSDRHRYHYVKAKVGVHRYQNGTLSLFHGPRWLATYDVKGTLKKGNIKTAA